MLIFALGAIDGSLIETNQRIEELEQQLGRTCDRALCAGNLGVWPDPNNLDRPTRIHRGPGDFAWLYINNHGMLRKTIFVSGAHEDHKWLYNRWVRNNLMLLPNLTWLPQGAKIHMGMEGVSVTGLGKVFSPKCSPLQSSSTSKHYTKTDLNRACAAGKTDILMTYEGPEGVAFGKTKSEARGITNVMLATHPKLLLHSAYNYYKEYEHCGTKCISLAKGQVLPIEYKDHMFNCLENN
jgi:hypothetical protein